MKQWLAEHAPKWGTALLIGGTFFVVNREWLEPWQGMAVLAALGYGNLHVPSKLGAK